MNWANSLINQLLKISKDTSDIKEILKNLGFEIDAKKISEEDLIFRLFGVNLVIQEKMKDKHKNINDLVHSIVAEKLFRKVKERKEFLELVRSRYEEYYYAISPDSQFLNIGSIFLTNLTSGKSLKECKEPIKEFNYSLIITEEFGNFLDYLRSDWFSNT